MRLAKGAWSHLAVGLVLAAAGVALYATGHEAAGTVALATGVAVIAFMLYFFRDPDRPAHPEKDVVVSGADGWVRQVELIQDPKYLGVDVVRICTFLTPFDVHVNRSPIAGKVTKLGYTPGRHFLTIRQEASDFNEHSSIYIDGPRIRCLVKQIVGPLVRRVVYWLDEGQQLGQGDRIGIMKFGSRLDLYLPASDVDVVVKRGDRVFAGITVVARIKGKGV